MLGGEDEDAPSAETARRLAALRAEGRPITTAMFPHAGHGTSRASAGPPNWRRSAAPATGRETPPETPMMHAAGAVSPGWTGFGQLADITIDAGSGVGAFGATDAAGAEPPHEADAARSTSPPRLLVRSIRIATSSASHCSAWLEDDPRPRGPG
jgi:hypothetical protein